MEVKKRFYKSVSLADDGLSIQLDNLTFNKSNLLLGLYFKYFYFCDSKYVCNPKLIAEGRAGARL